MKLTVRDMILISLFAVLTIIGGRISLTILAIPFTLQSLVSLLSGILLGAKRGILSQALYIALGLMGLPVFAAGGGIAYVLQPSFGFLIGMLLASGLVGRLCDRFDPTRISLKVWQMIPINLAGQCIVYLIGVAYLCFLQNLIIGQALPLSRAIAIGVLPFLIIDGLKSLLAAAVGPRLRRAPRRYLQQSD